MGSTRYSEEFREEAIKQVTEKGHRVADVAQRLGVTTWTLYTWLRHVGWTPFSAKKSEPQDTSTAEIKRLKAQIRRLEEERDILKKAAAYFAKESR